MSRVTVLTILIVMPGATILIAMPGVTILTANETPTDNYLMLSTHVNRRCQRIPENPLRSGSEDHQMKSGLPTMWSSGTKPQ